MVLYPLLYYSPPGYDYGCSDQEELMGVFSSPEQAEKYRKQLVVSGEYMDGPYANPYAPGDTPEYYWVLLKVEIDRGVPIYGQSDYPPQVVTTIPTT